MTLALRYAARSDRGLIREGNEDSVYAGPRLLAVADGMGGMAAGEVASNIVVAALAPLDEDAVGGDLVDALRRRISAANDQLRAAVRENPALEGMGTTLTALLFSGNRLALVHVGDSRAYVLRDGELTQITRDDTYVQLLVDEGRITPDEANTHPQRSLITRALQGDEIDPDFSVREARPGDRYLLCSDGLSGVVSAETMAEALQLAEPRDAADRLIALALRGGGPDNITCIVADILDVGPGDDAPVVGGAAARDRGRVSSASADTAAGRAALARPQREPDPDPEDDEHAAPPRRRGRTVVASILAMLLLAGAALGGWLYVQSQYYVGATEQGQVAVYRGMSGSVAGVGLSSMDEATDLRVEHLQPYARREVQQGIDAKDRDDADRIVTQLMDRQLPDCPDPASPSPSPSGSPSTSPSPSVPGAPLLPGEPSAPVASPLPDASPLPGTPTPGPPTPGPPTPGTPSGTATPAPDGSASPAPGADECKVPE